MPLNRFSSRRNRLYDAFLSERLKGAMSYDRIAGYVQSSLLGLAAHEFKAIKQVRIVCNTEVNPADVHAIWQAAGPRRAELEEALLRMVWNDGRFPHVVDVYGEPAKERLRVLQDLVAGDSANGRTFEIRIVPDCEFGFVHGKAGVMRYANGKATSFIGSANDTERAWSKNYELVWEDDTPESIQWVQEEAPQMNLLYEWGMKLAARARTMVLATATPVQLHPVELWDLLNVLGVNNPQVLGTELARWRDATQPLIFDILSGQVAIENTYEKWEYWKDPVPREVNNDVFRHVRNTLDLSDTDESAINADFDRIDPLDQDDLGASDCAT